MDNQNDRSIRQERDIKTLREFIKVYCRENHGRENEFCPNCCELLDYAINRILNCPQNPKPKCKSCKIKCFDNEHQKRIREVMKFSGIYFVKHGRVDWLIKYFL